MTYPHKLTTAAACRVVNMDRDRLNEHIAAERFPCAPGTTQGRTRAFDLHDLMALWLFNQAMKEGVEPKMAGYMACEIARAARKTDESTIAYVQTFLDLGEGDAVPGSQAPALEEIENAAFAMTSIRKVTLYNVGYLRKLLQDKIDQERAVSGERDE